MSDRRMRAGETRERARLDGTWKRRGPSGIRPCRACGAPDNRAPDHARGCPALPPVSKERLRELQLQAAAGWNATQEQAEERRAFAATAQ